MKELILDIVNQLELQHLESKVDNSIELQLYYYDNRQDYYLFVYTDIDSLEELSESRDSIEYFLNSLIVELKKDYLETFKKDSIDRNLSMVIVLKDSENRENDLQLYKIEENYFIAKKYVLTYDEKDYNELKKNLDDTSDSIVERLNTTLIQNNDLLESINENSWYNLLMKLFIKIPFFNYSSPHEKNITQLNDLIQKSFDVEENFLFEKILIYSDNDEMEDFVSQNNLINGDE